jgi:hypothetical protein
VICPSIENVIQSKKNYTFEGQKVKISLQGISDFQKMEFRAQNQISRESKGENKPSGSFRVSKDEVCGPKSV